MAKRKVNRTKRAKLNSKGFRVYKNFRLYIAEASEGGWSRKGKPAPRKEIVDMVRDMWNNDPSFKSMRKHIKEISIQYQKTSKYAGMWDEEKQKVTIIDTPNSSISWYKGTFVHEIIGHTFWDFARKWRKEELIAFNKLANELPPVNAYVQQNQERWKKINDDDTEIKKFQKKYENLSDDDIDPEQYAKDEAELQKLHKVNGHDTMTRYTNEQHSAITEIVYDTNRPKQLLNDSDVQRLVELWKKLHY